MKKQKKIQTASGLELLLDRVSPYNLTPQERENLRNLTNSPGSSEMQVYLDGIELDIEGDTRPEPAKQLVVFRAFHNEILVGWALLEPYWRTTKKGGINVFVAPDFRRKGVATALVAWVQEERPILFGESWSTPSYAFFDKMKIGDYRE